jgi:hypothetical protein
MLHKKPELRPSAQDIVDKMLEEDVIEMEVKFIKEENNQLKKKVEELEKKLEKK